MTNAIAADTMNPGEALVTVPGPRVHGTGGLGLAGLFGGPLAISWLILRDLNALGRPDRIFATLAWFVPLTAFWLICIFKIPNDLISQLIPFLPEVILWWMVARHLLADIHATHRTNGGLFRSKWAAVRTGLVFFGALKVLFFVGGMAGAFWHS